MANRTVCAYRTVVLEVVQCFRGFLPQTCSLISKRKFIESFERSDKMQEMCR